MIGHILYVIAFGAWVFCSVSAISIIGEYIFGPFRSFEDDSTFAAVIVGLIAGVGIGGLLGAICI